MEKLVEYRVSSGTSSSITFDEVQRLNKKLKVSFVEQIDMDRDYCPMLY